MNDGNPMMNYETPQVVGLEVQLMELRSRVARTQYLLLFVTGMLLLAIAGMAVLLFFPEWLPRRPFAGKTASQGGFKEPTVELVREVRDTRDHLNRELEDVRRDVKRDIAAAKNKAEADNVGLKRQLNSLDADLRRDVAKLAIELTKVPEKSPEKKR